MKILSFLTIINIGYYVSCSDSGLSAQNIAYISDVYSVLAKTRDTSFLISPVSLKMALGLLAYGADGNTYDEILQALHIQNDQELGNVVEKLRRLVHLPNIAMSSANICYYSQNIKISTPYYEAVREDFSSEIEAADFSKSTKVANKLNRWVQEKTHGKITNLVSKNDFNRDTLLVLINALYFHNNWLQEFRKASTRPWIFHKNSTVDAAVDMMSTKLVASFKDSQELNAKFIQLPYKESDYAMYVVIPKDVDGIKRLEARIKEVLSAKLNYQVQVYLKLPKFRTETKIDLIPVLEELGVYDAFDEWADFSRISHEFVEVTKILQKTFIEVDEKGTTAAAATTAQISLTSANGLAEDFVADRPFIYYIKYKDEVLFIGRYNSA